MGLGGSVGFSSLEGYSLLKILLSLTGLRIASSLFEDILLSEVSSTSVVSSSDNLSLGSRCFHGYLVVG